MANLGDLNPNERNPRRISEAQLAALKKSLAEFGPLDGFVFNRKTKRLIGGHQRQKSLPQNCPVKITEKISKPNSQGTIARGFVEMENGERITYREVSWNEQKEKAAMIAANKHSGEWENEILAGILSELNETDRELTGFELDEIQELLDEPNENAEADAEPQIDKAKELQSKWKTERGQIWELGNHRLMCGDSTNRENVEALINGDEIDLCFTSPPYSFQRSYRSGKDLSPKYIARFIKSWSADTRHFAINLGLARKNGEIDLYWDEYIREARDNNLKFLSWNIWYKTGGFSVGQITAPFPIEHEFIFIFGKDRTKLIPTVPNRGFGRTVVSTDRDADGEISEPKNISIREMRELGTVIVSPPVNTNAEHPAQFPISIPLEYILAFGARLIGEPFCGAGTTLIACEQLGRKCRAMEIDPGYVAVSLQRWSDATGKTPRLLTNGTNARTNRKP